ncbi:MAG: hypothetical protein E7371_00805 [Clostridiales bacterium]|nr:hypothetical protein [Clostridiales bacterium]
MKKIHLICNSHLDPVWMWDWEEGLSTAISTYYQAAEFCKEYNYVFCHNEAVLYEFVEEHDPALFAEIQQQVKDGKWHIMGGWYLQPDCNIPSGEAFVRQIKLGREYFAEKFDARPTTAINFDSFGHTVGLVQVLKKCGFDSYLFCRPMPEMLTLPDREFVWVGKDGSRIKASRAEDETIYCSGFGTALNDIKRKLGHCGDTEIGIALWGVGNHGGNPSRKDLEDVAQYIEEQAKLGVEVVHSTPEQYFADINPTAEWTKSLHPCLVGAYTSMSSIKQKHIELENRLFTTEKLCAMAELKGAYKKNQTAFTNAEKALASLEFHDVGSGTCAADGEKSSLRKCDCALEELQREFNKAFFALCSQDRKAGEGEFPFFVFNQQPYERETVVEMEYLQPESLDGITKQYKLTVRQNGQIIPSQCIKELSNINYDRRKRVAVKCTLPAMDIARFDLTSEVIPAEPEFEAPAGDIVVSDAYKTIRINRKTGLMDSYVVNGREMLSGGAFQPVMYDDNADPWGWDLEKIGENPCNFKLTDGKMGPFRGMESVKVVEEGDVLTEVESLFECEASFVRVSYKIYKNTPYVDVIVNALWNEKEKALKVKVPTALNGAFLGQVPFATDEYEKDGKENTMQRFVAMDDGTNAFAIYNDCTFGFSHDGDALFATLLRGVAYCAHPIGKMPLIKRNIFIPYVEQGRRDFRFRIAYDDKRLLENHAQEFINMQLALNFFPHGTEMDKTSVLSLNNQAISLVAFYKENENYVLRFVNNNDHNESATIKLMGESYDLSFGKYEAKTYILDGKSLTEKEIWY